MIREILEMLGIEAASNIIEVIIGLFPFAFTWVVAYAIIASILGKLGEAIFVDGDTPNPRLVSKVEIITRSIAGVVSLFVAAKLMAWDGWF